MNKHILIVLLSVASSMAFSSWLLAASSDAEKVELKAVQEAKLEAEYKQALATADKSRSDAAAAMEKAREQLHLATKQQKDENTQLEEQKAKRHAEMAAMREELHRAHSELRNASREIAQVSRNLVRSRMASEAPNFVFRTGPRPVLGVILLETGGGLVSNVFRTL